MKIQEERDGTIRIWDAQTGECIEERRIEEGECMVHFFEPAAEEITVTVPEFADEEELIVAL